MKSFSPQPWNVMLGSTFSVAGSLYGDVLCCKPIFLILKAHWEWCLNKEWLRAFMCSCWLAEENFYKRQVYIQTSSSGAGKHKSWLLVLKGERVLVWELQAKSPRPILVIGFSAWAFSLHKLPWSEDFSCNGWILWHDIRCILPWRSVTKIKIKKKVK